MWNAWKHDDQFITVFRFLIVFWSSLVAISLTFTGRRFQWHSVFSYFVSLLPFIQRKISHWFDFSALFAVVRSSTSINPRRLQTIVPVLFGLRSSLSNGSPKTFDRFTVIVWNGSLDFYCSYQNYRPLHYVCVHWKRRFYYFLLLDFCQSRDHNLRCGTVSIHNPRYWPIYAMSVLYTLNICWT